MLNRYRPVLLLVGLLLGLAAPALVKAQGGGETIGLASEPLACLAAGPDAGSLPAAGDVNITWQGQATSARLILTVSSLEAPATVRLNGRPVGQVPANPEGSLCRDGWVVYLDLPVGLVTQGQNQVELVADGQPGDTWSAAAIRLEVQGRLSPPPANRQGAAIAAAGATAFTFQFTNAYDNKTQEFRAQIPASYSGSPTPLLVTVHGRGGDMYFGESTFGPAVNDRGWLMASPQLHGHWPTPPSPPGVWAYASVESQYDIAGSIRYMVQHYNVDPERIYLVGYSMGGQTGLVAAAKFPHLFAAIFDDKGPTDMTAWYGEQVAYYGSQSKDHVKAMRQECYVVKSGLNKPAYPSSNYGSPVNPFCYQRRSGLLYPGNFIHLPLAVTHSISDVLVPISHSRNLRNAVTAAGPDQPVSYYEDPNALDPDTGQPCGKPWHCYEPDPATVLNFLEPFRRVANPAAINITTDLSKNYYWLTITQSGGDHWSQVQASYNLGQRTVSAVISDTKAVALSFNLGITPTTDIIPVPGIGLPAPLTYLVKGGGKNVVQDYTGGLLKVNLSQTGQYNLTVSAIAVTLSASPQTISANGVATTTLTAKVKDQLGNSAPNGVPVFFSTDRGTFPNGETSATATTSGGKAQIVLTSSTSAGTALATARVGYVTGSTTVTMADPARVAEPVSTSIYLPGLFKGE